MASGTVVSLNEYLATIYEPDCEYVDGEIVERNMGEVEHSGVQSLLLIELGSRRKEWGFHVFAEMRTQVSPTRYRVPDIAVTLEKAKGRILRVPPFLIIEILSPEDRASRMEQKIDDYFRFGVAHVWLIDPRKRSAWSYTQAGQRQAVDILTTSEPRIEISVQALFTELDEEIETD